MADGVIGEQGAMSPTHLVTGQTGLNAASVAQKLLEHSDEMLAHDRLLTPKAPARRTDKTGNL